MSINAQYLKNLQQSLDPFRPISLDAISDASLMDRVDTKFILHQQKITSILSAAQSSYHVLEISDARVMTYKNQYFDTEAFDCYTDHHNGKGHRFKVRIREYSASNKRYLEVKIKENTGRTKKKRKQIDAFTALNTLEGQAFVRRNCSLKSSISPVLQNDFKRITLIAPDLSERVTIDIGLTFQNGHGRYQPENLAIIEIKQGTFNRMGNFFQILKHHGILPYRVSKYCIGMAQLNPSLKQNIFKEKRLRINKVTAAQWSF
ncbi:polyphosphate polymerase domain-containing protein [Maribacter sp. 2-571]|uniref:polyphosphate polymerase domain-containing protein n=1 Tax=Maribacter sp. 2-571 TaxID=3417569 RepID=UPI003D335C4D